MNFYRRKPDIYDAERQ